MVSLDTLCRFNIKVKVKCLVISIRYGTVLELRNRLLVGSYPLLFVLILQFFPHDFSQ